MTHWRAVTTAELIVVAVAIFSASFTQVLAGFGFALLAMPIYETPMLNGSTIRVDGGQRFAPR